VTYNHEPYIAQALESVLAQKTVFPFEVLITEDCSTDSTRDIIIAYANKYPEKIRLILSERNINTNLVLSRAIAAARGDYLALLDGDDFWISEAKLQRQVEFLDARPDFALCFHNVWVMNDNGIVAPQPHLAAGFPETTLMKDILATNFVRTCSAMLRRAALGALPEWYDGAEYGDWPLWVLAAREGNLGYIDQPLAVYRQHAAGYWNRLNARQQIEGTLRCLDALELGAGPSFADVVEQSRAQWRDRLRMVKNLNLPWDQQNDTNSG
jgi:glycosyltransferase involved in cell wall biosynthesis